MVIYKCAKCEMCHVEDLMLSENHYDEDGVLIERVLLCPKCENDTFSVHNTHAIHYEYAGGYLM